MKSADSKRKQELEKRLRGAFPERWQELTEGQKEIAINRFYEITSKKIGRKELFSNVGNKGLSFGILFLGVVLALLGGLTVNILDRYFFVYGVWYQVSVPVIFFIVLWKLNQLLEDSVNQEYRDAEFLDDLLK